MGMSRGATQQLMLRFSKSATSVSAVSASSDEWLMKRSYVMARSRSRATPIWHAGRDPRDGARHAKYHNTGGSPQPGQPRHPDRAIAGRTPSTDLNFLLDLRPLS